MALCANHVARLIQNRFEDVNTVRGTHDVRIAAPLTSATLFARDHCTLRRRCETPHKHEQQLGHTSVSSFQRRARVLLIVAKGPASQHAMIHTLQNQGATPRIARARSFTASHCQRPSVLCRGLRSELNPPNLQAGPFHVGLGLFGAEKYGAGGCGREMCGYVCFFSEGTPYLRLRGNQKETRPFWVSPTLRRTHVDICRNIVKACMILACTRPFSFRVQSKCGFSEYHVSQRHGHRRTGNDCLIRLKFTACSIYRWHRSLMRATM